MYFFYAEIYTLFSKNLKIDNSNYMLSSGDNPEEISSIILDYSLLMKFIWILIPTFVFN